MSAESMARSAEIEKLRTGHPSLSVWSFPDMDARDVARAARESDPAALPHSSIRWTKGGALRDSGYELVQTDQPGHYSLMLPDPPSADDWATLDELFTPPEQNPVARG
jgi:hypothetical protein